jgi:hypothetical protein
MNTGREAGFRGFGMKITLPDYIVIGILFNALLLGGCGGGSKDSTGVTVSATITPTYNAVSTTSVDAVQDTCVSGSSTQAEYFADHGATVSISARLINPGNIIKDMTVYIDRYTIDYTRNADSPSAPPIQADSREMALSFMVSGDSTVSVETSATFVDLVRKNKYLADMQSGAYQSSPGYLNNYIAAYTFEGHSKNGVSFTVTAQSAFQIGSFNYCPAGYNPL